MWSSSRGSPGSPAARCSATSSGSLPSGRRCWRRCLHADHAPFAAAILPATWRRTCAVVRPRLSSPSAALTLPRPPPGLVIVKIQVMAHRASEAGAEVRLRTARIVACRLAIIAALLACVGAAPAVAQSLPGGWSTTDVGAVGATGSGGGGGGSFAVTGAGADIWGTADAFRYV